MWDVCYHHESQVANVVQPRSGGNLHVDRDGARKGGTKCSNRSWIYENYEAQRVQRCVHKELFSPCCGAEGSLQ